MPFDKSDGSDFPIIYIFTLVIYLHFGKSYDDVIMIKSQVHFKMHMPRGTFMPSYAFFYKIFPCSHPTHSSAGELSSREVFR